MPMHTCSSLYTLLLAPDWLFYVRHWSIRASLFFHHLHIWCYFSAFDFLLLLTWAVDTICPVLCLYHYLIVYFSITSSLYLGCCVICRHFRFLFHVRELYAKPFVAGGFSLACFCIYHHLASCMLHGFGLSSSISAFGSAWYNSCTV